MSLAQHLGTGATHVCRCWAVTRADGIVMGFTDHDRDLVFDGVMFRAGTGMTGFAVQQTTGAAVDNSEAMGILRDVTEADIADGLFDGAGVRAWLVRWDQVADRRLIFRGTIGGITRQGGQFTAELRGLSEALNIPGGRVYHRLDHTLPDVPPVEAIVSAVNGETMVISGLDAFDDGWFTRGVVTKQGGATAIVRQDRRDGLLRRVTLWSPLAVTVGDTLHLTPGYDGRFATRRDKFADATGFQGFPHLPGDDWVMSVPRRDGRNDGRSMNA